MKAIIIDDERLARTELKKLLQDFPEVEVIDEAANADEGVTKIESQNPDLVFLDIQMPGKTGFDMLASWNVRRRRSSPRPMMSSHCVLLK